MHLAADLCITKEVMKYGSPFSLVFVYYGLEFMYCHTNLHYTYRLLSNLIKERSLLSTKEEHTLHMAMLISQTSTPTLPYLDKLICIHETVRGPPQLCTIRLVVL